MIIAVPLLINILAIFIWFIHWHGYWKSLNLKAFYLSFMILSFFLWLQIKGLEFGAVYFFISTSIIGLLYLVESKHSLKDALKSKKHSSKSSHSNSSYSEPEKSIKISKYTHEYKISKPNSRLHISVILKSLMSLLLMILVPFCAAASISLLLPTVFGIQDVNILVSSLFVFLISWSLLLTWVYMKEQRTMALCLLSLASTITLGTIYITAIHTTDIPTIAADEMSSPIANTLPTNSL